MVVQHSTKERSISFGDIQAVAEIIELGELLRRGRQLILYKCRLSIDMDEIPQFLSLLCPVVQSNISLPQIGTG